MSVVEDREALPVGSTDQRPEAALLAYHRAIDTGRATLAIGLFADDALFQAKDVELIGRDAILAFLAERERQADRHTVHVVTNVLERRRADDEAELSALILLYVRQPDGMYQVERVLDTVHVLRHSPAGWRIIRRYSQALHAGGASSATACTNQAKGPQ